MEITDYRVITNEYSGALSNAVNQAIALGFQPYGALIVLPQGSEFYFAQPVVKYKEAEEVKETKLQTYFCATCYGAGYIDPMGDSHDDPLPDLIACTECDGKGYIEE